LTDYQDFSNNPDLKNYSVVSALDDIKIRPRKHVCDEIDQNSNAIADRYIDIELKE
jgi:hypothetical protein